MHQRQGFCASGVAVLCIRGKGFVHQEEGIRGRGFAHQR